MPRRFSNLPDSLREPHVLEWRGFWRVYAIAIVVAVGLGLASGLTWMAWQFFTQRVGR